MVGKSQIALEHAYTRRDLDSSLSVFWINASSALFFEQDFLQIGRLAKVHGPNGSNGDPRNLIRGWLNKDASRRWLLIVDNADDANIMFRAWTANQQMVLKRVYEFFPQSPRGSVLFTTRNKKVGVKFATAASVVLVPKNGSL